MLCFVRTIKHLEKLKNISKTDKGVYEAQFISRHSCYKTASRIPVKSCTKIMKLETSQFKSCITDEVSLLKELFVKNGHEIRIVGGAVRDLLMGIQPDDLDFASTATPSEMKRIFTENNIRLINTNGEKHGTITSRINERNFEVTTLRVDLATNGRHAEVQFTKDWILDANRRDLTINAMYLALDGTIYDYFNGLEDLKNKRVVFVGDAETRIQEDYLRILRYFRFFGKISDSPNSHDEDVLKAIKENAEGLTDISGERIWMEMNKILSGRFVDDIILKMINLGIGPYVGFPKEPNIVEFKRVTSELKMKDVKAKPITLMSALFNDENELSAFHLRVKLSNAEKDLAAFILNNRNKTDSDSLRNYKILYFNRNADFVYEVLKYEGKFDFIEELRNWKIPVFPVKGNVLKTFGIKGKDIGETLNLLKQIWYQNDFNISAEELLEHLPQKKKRLY